MWCTSNYSTSPWCNSWWSRRLLTCLEKNFVLAFDALLLFNCSTRSSSKGLRSKRKEEVIRLHKIEKNFSSRWFVSNLHVITLCCELLNEVEECSELFKCWFPWFYEVHRMGAMTIDWNSRPFVSMHRFFTSECEIQLRIQSCKVLRNRPHLRWGMRRNTWLDLKYQNFKISAAKYHIFHNLKGSRCQIFRQFLIFSILSCEKLFRIYSHSLIWVIYVWLHHSWNLTN